jgi:hypothetical protein
MIRATSRGEGDGQRGLLPDESVCIRRLSRIILYAGKPLLIAKAGSEVPTGLRVKAFDFEGR